MSSLLNAYLRALVEGNLIPFNIEENLVKNAKWAAEKLSLSDEILFDEAYLWDYPFSRENHYKNYFMGVINCFPIERDTDNRPPVLSEMSRFGVIQYASNVNTLYSYMLIQALQFNCNIMKRREDDLLLFRDACFENARAVAEEEYSPLEGYVRLCKYSHPIKNSKDTVSQAIREAMSTLSLIPSSGIRPWREKSTPRM